MRKGTDKISKTVIRVAYLTSKQSANSVCGFFFYQPQLPEKVKKLRKN
ncbi:MAG: cyclic lactone autoinducer peptide [Lachnospiraceae bacterium]|nr:cyclic lactone autoinducer peptide [Lachnospiraceae bacterium]